MNLTTKHARTSRVGSMSLHRLKIMQEVNELPFSNVKCNLVLVFIFLTLSLWARAWGQSTNQNACSMSQIWCAQFEWLLHGARCLKIHKIEVRCLSLLSLPWVVNTIIYIKMGLRHPLDVSLGESTHSTTSTSPIGLVQQNVLQNSSIKCVVSSQ